jgi:hypothetical protein
MKENSLPSSEIIIPSLTVENREGVLKEVARVREQKGTSEFLIPQIDQLTETAIRIGDYTSAMRLTQEKYLSAQHMPMESGKKNPTRSLNGLALMRKSINDMSRLKRDHQTEIDPIWIARVFRFQGRFCESVLVPNYHQSEKYYRRGIRFYNNLEPIEQRHQSLELSGFLSFSLLKQGEFVWYGVAQQTLLDFDESPEGEWLKSHDYYTWAVWKSGIEIRNSNALLGTPKESLYRENIASWLVDADNVLTPDHDFSIRRQELSEVQSRLK